MALTQIADVFDEDTILSYVDELNPTKTVLGTSGLIATNPILQSQVNSAGSKISIPFWKALPQIEPNISDDTETVAPTNKMATDEYTARKAWRNIAYKTADLVSFINGSDANQAFGRMVGLYWVIETIKECIQHAIGVKNADSAGAGEMTYSVATEDGNNATASNLISSDAIIEAESTMGENWNKVTAIAVHPDVLKTLRKLNVIDDEYDSQLQTNIQTYQGKTVFESKLLPVRAGTTSGLVYTTILYGQGAIGYAMGSVGREGLAELPIEIDRQALQGKGGGTSAIVSRRSHLIHVGGTSFTSASVAGVSPSYGELALATNHAIVADRENIALAFLETNG